MKKFVLLICFVAVNLIFYSNILPLKHEEPRRAIIAQEMVLTGNYIVPKICQVPYYKKPPFHNWLIAIGGIKDRYISNFDARVVSLISLILMSLFIFILLNNWDTEKRLFASVIGLTSFSTMISYGMKAEPDMLFTSLFFISYFFFIKNKNFISSVFMGASILTKGISPIFFYPSMIIYSFFEDNKKNFLKKLTAHFFLSLILPLIWLILYHFYGNISNLFHYMFFEVKDRAVSSFYDILSDAFLFPFRAFLALFPWSLLFIIFFNKNKFYKVKQNKIFLSSLIIFLFIFSVLFIFPCGKGRYFLPAVPFFGIIAASFIDLKTEINETLKKIIFYFTLFAFFSAAIFLIYKQYYLQGLVIVISGILFGIILLKIVKIEHLFLCLALIILFLSSHLFNFYRSKYMYNYHKVAKIVANSLKKYNLPIVVDNSYSKLRFLFNLEREIGRPLYAKKYTNFKNYILLTAKKLSTNKPVLTKRIKNKTVYFYLIEK